MERCVICEKALTPDELVFCETCEVFYEYELKRNRKHEGFDLLKQEKEEED